MATRELSGVRVIVAGGGLAGLAAARDLEASRRDRHRRRSARSRRRPGPDGPRHFSAGQHAEAGADLIEGEQSFVRELAAKLKLKTARILRDGFGYYGPRSQRPAPDSQASAHDASAAARLLKNDVADYCLAGQAMGFRRRAEARALVRRRVAGPRRARTRALTAGMRGLRGFFLADPEDLSLIALVDQFASEGPPGQEEMYRIIGGNDRLPHAIAAALAGKVLLQAAVRRILQAGPRLESG